MKKLMGAAFTISVGALLVTGMCRAQSAQEHKIDRNELERAEIMLQDVHEALKKNYYDPTFHGIDVDARYKTYLERVKKSKTLGDAFRTVAAYLAGLDDSHTFFIPPRRSYRADYGYRMQLVGDACYITEVRPGTDAEKKLHPGDQVQSLDGFAVNRKDLWQLQYYLTQLAPKPATEFTLRSPSGEVRKEQVLTTYEQRKHLQDLTTAGGFNDFNRLILEEEEHQHLLTPRHVEQGDVMIWKMPAFTVDEEEIDHMVRLARKHKALILDLRDNPGGYMIALDRMIGSLFDHNVTISTQILRKGKKPQIAKSRGKEMFTGKVIVLVDSGSASAAELFARVMQLEHRATVVGDRSSGLVMEALHYPFHTNGDIQVFYGASITEADLIMSDGKSLEKVGVTPDVIVLPTASELAEGQDPALAKAAELAGTKLDPTAAGKLFPFEWAPL
ncbi:MAG: S41 family peptidase [Candidatus Acidiferrales bacterium]